MNDVFALDNPEEFTLVEPKDGEGEGDITWDCRGGASEDQEESNILCLFF